MNFVVLFVCVHVHLHTCEQVDRCAHVEVIGQLRYQIICMDAIDHSKSLEPATHSPWQG